MCASAVLSRPLTQLRLHFDHYRAGGFEIKLEDLPVQQRAVWDGSTLKINTKHKSLSRYLGPKPKGWPGQNSVHAKTVMAEIASAALARKVMQNRTDLTNDWSSFEFMMMEKTERFLPQIHNLLIPSAEVPRY